MSPAKPIGSDSAYERHRRAAPDRQHQSASFDDGKGAVDAGKCGEGPVGRDARHADAPVERIQRGT